MPSQTIPTPNIMRDSIVTAAAALTLSIASRSDNASEARKKDKRRRKHKEQSHQQNSIDDDDSDFEVPKTTTAPKTSDHDIYLHAVYHAFKSNTQVKIGFHESRLQDIDYKLIQRILLEKPPVVPAKTSNITESTCLFRTSPALNRLRAICNDKLNSGGKVTKRTIIDSLIITATEEIHALLYVIALNDRQNIQSVKRYFDTNLQLPLAAEYYVSTDQFKAEDQYQINRFKKKANKFLNFPSSSLLTHKTVLGNASHPVLIGYLPSDCGEKYVSSFGLDNACKYVVKKKGNCESEGLR